MLIAETIDAQALEILIRILRYVGWVVLVAAGRVFVYGLRAEAATSKAHSNDIRDCRDRTRLALLLPTVAQIVVVAHETLPWPRRASREEMRDRLRKELSVRVADFAVPLADIETHGGTMRDADLVQAHLVDCRRAQGRATWVFIPCWLGLLIWAYYGKHWAGAFPVALGVSAAIAFGWWVAETVRGVAEENALSRLKGQSDHLYVAGGDE